MKLKNIMNDVRMLRDNGKVIEVGPGEVIEVKKPAFNKNAFEIQKSKEKKEQETVKKGALTK